MKSLIIAGCCKNVGKYLPSLFKNIDLLREWFYDVKIVFAYDKSVDNTLGILEQYKLANIDVVRVIMCNNQNKLRTVNIASARNDIMKLILISQWKHDLLCFMDCDDIISGVFIKNTFVDIIDRWDSWDAISFNRRQYYDIWALRYEPYLCSCWGFGNKSSYVVNEMQGDISGKLTRAGLDYIEVASAFGGLAFFKLDKYRWIAFDGYYKKNDDFSNPFLFEYNPSVDDCEWVAFHRRAKDKYPDLKIVISPLMPY